MDRRARAIILAFADAHRALNERVKGDTMWMNLTIGIGGLGGRFLAIKIFLDDKPIMSFTLNGPIHVYYDSPDDNPQGRYVWEHSDGIKALLRRMIVPEDGSITLKYPVQQGMEINITDTITLTDPYRHRVYISEKMCLEIFDAVLLNLSVDIKPLTPTENPMAYDMDLPGWSH
jgi:hypothetical protein